MTLTAMDTTTAHLAGYGCTLEAGDRIVRAWSEVTCASCLGQMPSTASNGCAHERMILVAVVADPCSGVESEKWSCPCGYGERRAARA